MAKNGTVITRELEAALVAEAEAGYDFEIICYVDPDFVDPDDPPVTLRSTKTRKEAPQSPQEPFTPRLVTRGKGQGREAASEPLDGRNGQNSVDPLPEFQPGPESDKITGLQTLYCENGDHDWTRPAVRGRKPASCPHHPNPARDRNEDAATRKRRAERRVMLLEEALKINGSHISQHR